jgi:hypothetical protein
MLSQEEMLLAVLNNDKNISFDLSNYEIANIFYEKYGRNRWLHLTTKEKLTTNSDVLKAKNLNKLTVLIRKKDVQNNEDLISNYKGIISFISVLEAPFKELNCLSINYSGPHFRRLTKINETLFVGLDSTLGSLCFPELEYCNRIVFGGNNSPRFPALKKVNSIFIKGKKINYKILDAIDSLIRNNLIKEIFVEESAAELYKLSVFSLFPSENLKIFCPLKNST